MRINWIGSAFVCMAFAFGCGGGGGGGLDESLLLVDLLPEEIDDVCASVENRVVDCGDFEIEFSVDTCVENLETLPETCAATVGDQLDCEDAIASLSDDEICDETTPLPVECEALLDEDCL